MRPLEERQGSVQPEVLQEVLRVYRIELSERPRTGSVEYEVDRRKQLYVCIDPPVKAVPPATYVEADRNVASLGRWHRSSVHREELKCSDQGASPQFY